MKYKTTRKAIVSGSSKIVYAGYCELSYLLRYHQPTAYTSGVYGWNFDVYEVYGLTICTGYRNMPGRRANNIATYEDAARATVSEDPWNPQTPDKVENLLVEFCKQA